MELLVLTIRDQKAGVYNTPFFQATMPEAQRNFHKLVNDKQSLPSLYPEDFDLYQIGTYDQNTGLVSTFETPKHIAKATQQKVQ